MKTTLNMIKAKEPCKRGWKLLMDSLGKRDSDDVYIDLEYILNSNGISDAVWALGAVDGYTKEKRMFAINCCRRVDAIMRHQTYADALNVGEGYAYGIIDIEETNLIRSKLKTEDYSWEYFSVWYSLMPYDVHDHTSHTWLVIDVLMDSKHYGGKDLSQMIEEEFIRLCRACP